MVECLSTLRPTCITPLDRRGDACEEEAEVGKWLLLTKLLLLSLLLELLLLFLFLFGEVEDVGSRGRITPMLPEEPEKAEPGDTNATLLLFKPLASPDKAGCSGEDEKSLLMRLELSGAVIALLLILPCIVTLVLPPIAIPSEEG